MLHFVKSRSLVGRVFLAGGAAFVLAIVVSVAGAPTVASLVFGFVAGGLMLVGFGLGTYTILAPSAK